MKFSIEQKILFEHLNYVIRGISSKNLIPVLNCIKFELKEDGLYLISTDNEIAIKTFINKKDIKNIEIQGECVIAGKYIYEIVRKLGSGIINIEEVIDSQVLITTENSSFKLNCNNVSEFPTIDFDINKQPVTLKQKEFKEIINQTIFATSTQESRPVLTGINFKLNNNILECTATDSYRLSKKIIQLTDEFKEKINIIIPSKNLLEIVKLINDDNKDLTMYIFNNKVIFKFNDIIIMSRIINGEYPPTDKLIPDNFLINIKVNLEKFYNAIDRASLLTNTDEKNIIKFETNGDLLKISSNIPEIGNVEEKLVIKKDQQEDIKISFSSKYMLDAIKTFDSEEIKISLNGEIKPIIITNGVDNDLIQLIVPIRTY